MVIEFTENIGPIEQEMIAMYNERHISEEAVREYICANGSNMGYSEWIAFMTKEQYENLKDIVEPNPNKTKDFIENNFYNDLIIEQQEEIV
jgi:hypothetical protein